MAAEEKGADLELEAAIGFAGKNHKTLALHPNDQHLVYPLGTTVVVRDVAKETQRFMTKGGHKYHISCLTISPCGKYIASGEAAHQGVKADVIVWEFESGKVVHRLNLHKQSVQDIAFSKSGKYLATLGGEGDNNLVMWDLRTGDAVCGSPAANDQAICLSFFNNDDKRLVTAGRYNIRTWEFDAKNRKLRFTDCNLGSYKRIVHSCIVDDADKFMYCGTSSGDVLKIDLNNNLFKQKGPSGKAAFSQGVRSMIFTNKGHLVVGSGAGVVALLDSQQLKQVRTLQLDKNERINSLCLNKAGDHFFVGTSRSSIYLAALEDFDYELRSSCHYGRINGVGFPCGLSTCFISYSTGDIRIWKTDTCRELVRIQVPNQECFCAQLTTDGTNIVSGWSDGKIRAFLPQSGRLVYTIEDAHEGGVTSLMPCSDNVHIISGGAKGDVRVWRIGSSSQHMEVSLKEHKDKVTSITINADGTEFATSSHDGSCLVWDMKKYHRVNALFNNTKFNCIQYHPDGSQLVTTGFDRKITNWCAVEATAIRVVDGSENASVNHLAMSPSGNHFVSGGNDKLVRLWHYDQGEVTHIGEGHSDSVMAVVVSPDEQHIVSVGAEGGIFIWRAPSSVQDANVPDVSTLNM